MAPAKKTPADELAEADQRIDALVKEGEDLSARRGEAEALLRSHPSRREDALRLRKLGEEVDMPDEAEYARLQRFVADAKTEQDAILWARRQREDERKKVLAAGVPHFDGEAEQAARTFEAKGEVLLAALGDFQAAQQANGEAWGLSNVGRKELGCDQMQIGYHDLGTLRGEIKDAVRRAWPWHSEERWREFVERERVAEGTQKAPRQRNREALAHFAGER